MLCKTLTLSTFMTATIAGRTIRFWRGPGAGLIDVDTEHDGFAIDGVPVFRAATIELDPEGWAVVTCGRHTARIALQKKRKKSRRGFHLTFVIDAPFAWELRRHSVADLAAA